MTQAQLRGAVVLEAACAFVPVRRMLKLIGDALTDQDEAFEFGFNIDDVAIVRTISAWRDAGKLVVFWTGGRGVIMDIDVLHGSIRREDFARFLAENWHLGLLEQDAATNGSQVDTFARTDADPIGCDESVGRQSASNLDIRGKRERQISAILDEIGNRKLHPLRVPLHEKQRIGIACRDKHPQLFGAGKSPFLDAWKKGSVVGDNYLGRSTSTILAG